MLTRYPSQASLFGRFEKVLRAISLIGKVARKDWSLRGYLGCEQISPVPADFDYTRPPRAIDFFNYMFEDFEKRPITFKGNVRPITQHFL